MQRIRLLPLLFVAICVAPSCFMTRLVFGFSSSPNLLTNARRYTATTDVTTIPSREGMGGGVRSYFGYHGSSAGSMNSRVLLKASHAHKTAVAGKIIPFFTKIKLTEAKAESLGTSLANAVDLREFGIICLIAWGMEPFVEMIFNTIQSKRRSRDNTTSNNNQEAEVEAIYTSEMTAEEYWDFLSNNNILIRWLFQTTNAVSKAAKIAGLVYLIDIVSVILNSMGFKKFRDWDISDKAGNIAIIYFVTLGVRAFKSYFLFRLKKKIDDKILKRRVMNSKSNKETTISEETKLQIWDRVIDSLLYFFAFVSIVDQLKIQFGVALSSVFAFGGIGTLIFSLASKDLATQLISALLLRYTAPFLVGEAVELGDGTKGKVVRIGLLTTDIRGGDEIITTIPNSKITNQRINNISRVQFSQIKQTLRFRYEDVKKIPSLIETMKNDILVNCNKNRKLIVDGTRPFRVTWTEYKLDHLEVVVDCHFKLKPGSDEFHRTQQALLEAISTAVEKEKVQFALPTSITKNFEMKN